MPSSSLFFYPYRLISHDNLNAIAIGGLYELSASTLCYAIGIIPKATTGSISSGGGGGGPNRIYYTLFDGEYSFTKDNYLMDIFIDTSNDYVYSCVHNYAYSSFSYLTVQTVRFSSSGNINYRKQYRFINELGPSTSQLCRGVAYLV